MKTNTNGNRHTPGPWAAEQNHEAQFQIVGPARDYCLAFVQHPEANSDELKANAALIAAAPELLAALEETAAILRQYRQTGHMSGWDLVHKNVVAALSKAKGNQ